MRPTIFLFVLAAAASGCKSVDCGPGTIERGGTCAPADETTGNAACGSGTMLDGDRCVPIYAPTTCDPSSTTAQPDPNDPGVTICYGTGGGGCGTPLNCPAPAPGKQTICGQLYDITNNSKFQQMSPAPTGAKCDGTMTEGPCALAVNAFDALMYGMDPTMAVPLGVGSTYIDDCGRFKLTDVSQPSSPYIGLGFDDASPSNMGPNGVTNTTGVAVNAQSGAVTDDVEAWVVPKATSDMWTASGGPPVSGGIYVGIFRTHKCDSNGTCTGDKFANQAGVTMTKFGQPVPNNDYYFMAAETGHTMIDPNATATGSNGTGLETGASVTDGLKYSGTGGISDTTDCTWEAHAAASLANIVFFQVYRPQNQIGHQCAQ
jgi:hypothetical protein